MGRIPITALEELIKTNVMIGINNPTKIFKVGEWSGTSIIGPADGSTMDFYFGGKKNYGDYDLEFIDSDINIEKDGHVSFHHNGKSYEIHKVDETMPNDIEYATFSREGYTKRFSELYTKHEDIE